MIDRAWQGNNALMSEAQAMAGQPLDLPGHCPKEAGDERTRELVAEHFDFVWRLLCRLGVPRPDVDDAAQQVFIAASQRLADIPKENERTFLYGTALRVAATLRRNLKRRQRVMEPGPADAASHEPTPHEELERRRALAFLDEVLHELDDPLREVFVLCEIEELSAPQVAAIASIPVGTVASRLRRARQAFKDQVRRLQAQKVTTR
jgi:RNA polymerase sigma-70 factor (ECF subfamily)